MTLPTKEQAEEALQHGRDAAEIPARISEVSQHRLATLLALAEIGKRVAYGGEEVVERVAMRICAAGQEEAGFFGVTAEEAAEAEAHPMPCVHSCVACRNVARAVLF